MDDMTRKRYKAIGLMSGTSLDGVDAALIETDGEDYAKPLGFHYEAYDEQSRAQIKACFGRKDRNAEDIKAAERLLTLKHAEVVKALLRQESLEPSDIDYIGFHGQTIFHAPAERLTIQLGDGDLLAAETGIRVIYDFRSNDVGKGGEGAPLAPVYHRALAKTAGIEPPFVILNIGGVSNVTWIGRGADDILAFDTGPGNALMDDFVQKQTGARYDEGGKLAAAGTPNKTLLNEWLAHDYFKRMPPKSLDRDEWDIAVFGALVNDSRHCERPEEARQSRYLNNGTRLLRRENAPRNDESMFVSDTLSTLLHFTAQTILKSRKHMPAPPKIWYACGGGRHNSALMALLSENIPIKSIDDLGWDGDAIEAECFAYLAVRSVLELPISFPNTTGAKVPLSGGRFSNFAAT